MKTITLTDDSSAKEALDQGQNEEVIVLRDGQPVAMVVPFDEDDLEWYARERDPEFLASIARAREQIRTGQGISHVELKRQLGIP
jgi:antitoxin (DNA-binding transcriptional repressor) of toxin-antitoxin stability system